MEERIPTQLWLEACLRPFQAAGGAYYIVHRGDNASGTVVVKLVLGGGKCKVLSQARDVEGAMGWMAAFEGRVVDDAEGDGYLTRAAERDPDVWVVEIESKDGVMVLPGRVF